MDGLSSRFHFNQNLLSLIFPYLTCKDISVLSKMNKFLYSFTAQRCAVYWREECNNYFCSSYEKNRIHNIDSIQQNSLSISSNYSSYKKKFDIITNITNNENNNFNWKKCFSIGIAIKLKWEENILYINGQIENELTEMKNFLYNSLKEYCGFPKLRKKNVHFENDINTSLQLALYDLLANEEEFYEENYKYLTNKNNNIENCTIKNFIFYQFVIDFDSLVNQLINKQNLLNDFCDLRWFNYKIDLNFDCMNDNLILFILKAVTATINHYTLMSYNYLLERSLCLSEEEFLQEFYMRYKNFVETAIEFNDKYRYINLIVDCIYEKFRMNLTTKFSFLRLFLIIWNNECSVKLYQIIMDKTKPLLEKLMQNDFHNIHNYNDSNYSLKKINDFNLSVLLSLHSTNTSSFQLIPSSSFSYSSQSSYQKPNEETINKEIIAVVISCLNDTFCNEYTIFQINLSTIETNDIYKHIESIICQVVKEQIILFYTTSIKTNKDFSLQKFINDILWYFSNSEFFTHKFINKLLLSITHTVYNTLELIVKDEILNRFTIEIISSNLYQTMTFSQIEEQFDQQKENMSIFIAESMSNLNIPYELKLNLANIYIQRITKEKGNVLDKIYNWLRDGEREMLEKNRKINKELKKRKALHLLVEEKKKIISLSWVPNIKDIISYERAISK